MSGSEDRNRFYKTALCRYWPRDNQCVFSQCRFAHGVEELRPRQVPQQQAFSYSHHQPWPSQPSSMQQSMQPPPQLQHLPYMPPPPMHPQLRPAYTSVYNHPQYVAQHLPYMPPAQVLPPQSLWMQQPRPFQMQPPQLPG